jgi:aspartyl-tRNA(Asn)/glutamyl-tRNA(Gln) amidotransferase subunit B
MNNFCATIGIEVHTELNTNSKMFSSSPVSFIDQPNTNINEIDLGLPGVLPSPNQGAVIKGIQLATALNMKIDPLLRFDRKNYFYQDLPKGFQITQQYHPIGKDGSVTISNKLIRIERIHLEEDTAKQQIINNELCLDYNRCGIPLIEIVSRPDITTAKEAVEYLNELRRILIFLNISDGKMEEGSFRADINISVAPIGAKTLGTKVEIKNINSFANVAAAIEYEFQRQVRQLLNGEPVIQETRRWDDKKNKTIFMRLKLDDVDYRYFREPNIIQLDISHLVEQAQASMQELPKHIKEKLLKNDVPINLIEQLLDNYDACQAYMYVNNQVNNASLVTA